MIVSLTVSQINQLGRRLGDRLTPISLDDRRALQHFISAHQPALEYAEQTVQQTVDARPSSRLKTAKTTIEKLTRQKTRLSKMQDIAGQRIVVDTFWAQDAVVAALAQAFTEVRIEDRRSRPQHGYRAVHVIPTIDGRQVEIQIRTEEQHVWADLVEQLGDAVGREIRYGAVPIDPVARRIFSALMELSEHDIEQGDREFLRKTVDLESKRRRLLRVGVPSDPVEKRERANTLRKGRRLALQGISRVLDAMEQRRLSREDFRQLAIDIREGRVAFQRGVEWLAQ